MTPPVPHSRPDLGDDEALAARRVVQSGQLAQGPEVAALEAEVAARLQRQSAVAVASGTAALHLALVALGVGPEGDVVVPSYACAALHQAIRAAGAGTVPADIDPVTRNLCAQTVRPVLSSRTRALIVPHMFGRCAPMAELVRLGVPVVEDCAMSIGAQHAGRPAGAWGTVSVCSFYATKMLAGGEGGMVLADDEQLAAEVRARREYDGRPCDRLRLNYKMTDLSAAIARVQLRRLDEFLCRRRAVAAQYDSGLVGASLALPEREPGQACFRYVVASQRPAGELIQDMEAAGICARRPVPTPLHRELHLPDAPYVHTSAAHAHDVSLPLYPSLTATEIERVIAAARAAAGPP